MSSPYVVRDYEPKDEKAVLAVVEQALGVGPVGRRDEAFWRWKHRDNYFGPSFILLAQDPLGETVGVRAYMQWRFRAGDHVIQAVRPVDAATHPGYRRAGIFSTLTRQMVDKVREAGFELALGLPNSIVMPGYMKLGWTNVATIRPMVKVLNYPRFVTALLRSRGRRQVSQACLPGQALRHEPLRVSDILKQGDEIERLAMGHDGGRDSRIGTCHSAAYFSWRYGQHPYVDYRVVCEKRKGELVGCLIFRMSSRFGLKEAMLDELLLARRDERVALSLLHSMKACVSADYIVAQFPGNTFEHHALRRFGFHRMPKQAMTPIVNSLVPDIQPDPLRWDNWDLSLGDLEMF